MSSSNQTANGKRRIDEELVSADSLKHVLYTRCGCKEVHIHREEHDPPDFTVIVDGDAFPAEVTSIVSRQQYAAQCMQFAQVIRDRAASLGVLSGTYAFLVSRFPDIPKPTSRTGNHLIDTAVAYVSATSHQETSPTAQLVQAGSGKISIVKLSASGASVALCRTPSAMRGGDVQNQLASLIQRAVDDKRHKLQDAGIGSGRALLLLYDAFAYAEPEDAAIALQQVRGYNWFHSVFWAASFFDRKNDTYPEEPGREGLFLYSSNPDWDGTGSVS